MLMSLDPISREYVSLSFAIDRLFPGFIDAYFGPPELKAQALAVSDSDTRSLAARIALLAGNVESGDYSDTRRGYLRAQIRAMATIVRKLAGESIGYIDEVSSCFDIEPTFTPESVFEEAIQELHDLLPGTGDARERMIAWRAGYVVSLEAARRSIDLILNEARRRTEEFQKLPPDEEVEIVFVEDKPWSGYNWYLGKYRSRVDINTDLPIHAHELASLITHEAYPGHHAEHALKEQVLVHERGYGEHTIQLINTPECVISEGIATLAESIIFPDNEGIRWQAETLYPAAGIVGEPEREARISQARVALRAVGGNAALLLHDRSETEDNVVAYLMRYGLNSEKEALQRLRFIADPLWRPYIFTYHVGRDLLGKWLQLLPTTEQLGRFRSLLIEQITPSHIAQQIATGNSEFIQ
jgi:hypothetical protein